MKKKLEGIMAEYGAIALIVYLSIFGLTITGFAMAIRAGIEVEGVAGGAGVWTAAWIATKLTQPLRIGATLVLTPVVGALWHRTPWGRRRKQARDAAAAAEAAAEAEKAAAEAAEAAKAAAEVAAAPEADKFADKTHAASETGDARD